MTHYFIFGVLLVLVCDFSRCLFLYRSIIKTTSVRWFYLLAVYAATICQAVEICGK